MYLFNGVTLLMLLDEKMPPAFVIQLAESNERIRLESDT